MKDVASIEIVVTMKSGEVSRLGSRPGEVVENFSFEHARGIVAVHPLDGQHERFVWDGKRTLELKAVFRRDGAEEQQTLLELTELPGQLDTPAEADARATEILDDVKPR